MRGDVGTCDPPLPDVIDSEPFRRATRTIQCVHFLRSGIIEQAESISDDNEE